MSPSPSVTSAASLDAQALQRLRELDPSGQNRLIERVLGAFQSSTLRLGEQLDTARSGADLPAIRHVVHTLKSSSASIGALDLARLCAEIEASIRDQTTAGLTALLEAMDRELALVLQAVQHTLEDGRGMQP
ncbi:MAG: Hpt domain-containing protein [Pseudomonadota bacterium]|nr:Hpt domain-containing protein [Pseudomonadota bacterium]